MVPPLPATILTGYLGAGKTTLLNHVLKSARSTRIGVLVNELGAVDIDSALLPFAEGLVSGSVVELSNGCICCTINEGLREACIEMVRRRADLDHLLIETTGVADPGPVLTTLRLPEFGNSIRVDAVVTVVDAASVARSLSALTKPDAPLDVSDDLPPSDDPECFKLQLASADLLVVNKTDLLPVKALERVREQLEKQAPHARQLTCERGRLAPELLITPRMPDMPTAHEEPAPPDAAASGSEYRPNYVGGGAAPAWTGIGRRSPSPRGGRSSPGHLAQDGFRSISYRSSRPLLVARFERLRRSAVWRSVVRAKGFLSFAECSGFRLTMQQAGGRLEVTSHEGGEKGGEGRAVCAEGGCVLVMIGQFLEEEALLSGLRACEAPPDEDLPTAMSDLVVCGDSNATGDGVSTELVAVAETLAARVKRDTRFDASGVSVLGGGSLVAIRMYGWLGVGAEQLTTELIEQINCGSSSGSSWVAPCRQADGTDALALTLLQPLVEGDDAKTVWRTIYNATEAVMAAHFAAIYCGGCDCLENLAGQVLT